MNFQIRGGSLFFLLILVYACSFGQENKFGTYYNQRYTLFQKLPDTKGEIIFLGNSITDGGEWCELLRNKNVKNRGISGDTTEGVLFRLGEVTKAKPKMVFLLIGINDLAHGSPKDTVFRNICTIARNIRRDSPKTKVFVQSILPVNPVYSLFKGHTNKTDDIIWINDQLKAWCAQEKFQFIDLFTRFKSPENNLMNPQLSNDGLHVTGDGYLLWAEILKPYVK